MPGMCVACWNDASLVSLFLGCHHSHESMTLGPHNDSRAQRPQIQKLTLKLFMSNTWPPGYRAWMLNSHQYSACVGHKVWGVEMLTVCHTIVQWRPVWRFQLKNDGWRMKERKAFLTPLCSAPWDRKHKRKSLTGQEGERLACWQLPSLSPSHTQVCIFT